MARLFRHEHSHVRSVTTTVPAVRMVCVHAWSWTEDDVETVCHEIIPVVAIETIVIDEFSHVRAYEDEPKPYAPATPELLEKAGWRFLQTYTRHRPLIVPDESSLEGELLTVEDRHGDNTAETVVACPWNADQDEFQLSEIIMETRKRASEKSWFQSKSVASATTP